MRFSLLENDEIRIIAPSASWTSGNTREYKRAEERLKALGYRVSYGKNIKKISQFGTATAQDRADDFNDAYKDPKVKLVMALRGGWSSNDILTLIDWELVASNPKPLIGFSDITALLNAIYAKTGQSGLLGPNFSTIGAMPEWRYTLDSFSQAMQGNSTLLKKSMSWSDYSPTGYTTKPWKTIYPGEASAVVIGGNLGTFYLLQGTEYQPRFDEPFIFLLEDDDEAGIYAGREVSRRLESLLQLPNFRDNLKGLVIGRFQPGSKVTEKDVVNIVKSKKLEGIPVISNVDFGHTLPMATLPIGRNLSILANTRTAQITF